MERKTLIFSGNFLLAEGIISLIKKNVPEVLIQVVKRIVYKDDPGISIIFIDDSSLPDPAKYSLERIRKHFTNAHLILLCSKLPGEELQPYLESWILTSDEENIIHGKIVKQYARSEKNTHGLHANSVLSERETEVLRAVALGLTNREISDELCISTHTVITHRKNITAKLSIKTIAGLAVYAVINGIISSEEMKG
jgi:DNA-binding CsgD family transcriptional regulator